MKMGPDQLFDKAIKVISSLKKNESIFIIINVKCFQSGF